MRRERKMKVLQVDGRAVQRLVSTSQRLTLKINNNNNINIYRKGSCLFPFRN